MPVKNDSVASDKRIMEKKVNRKKWAGSVGIEKVGSGQGLVLSVTPGSKAKAEDFVKSLNLSTPVRVREMRAVRARG